MTTVDGALDTLRRYATHLSVLVLAALAYVPALLSSPGRMPADTKLYLYLDPGRLTSDAPWTFDRRQFGGWVPHQHITYLWPSGPWYWFWDRVGAPDWLAHRLWLGTLFLLAGLGVRWLARTLGIGVAGALVAAIVYQLSPYVLPYVSRTSLMLLPWAGLGWIVALTARAATRSRWRDAAVLALVIAVVGSPNATALAMVAPAPVLWLVHAAWGRTISWRRAALTAARIAVLSIGVSLWWIAMLMVQGRYGADVLAYSESLEAVSFTSNASEVIRGLGYWLFYLRDAYAPTTSSAWDYLSSSRLIAVGYVLVAACIVGMVATRWAHRRFALLVFAAGVLLAVGVHPLDDPAPITDWLVGDTESGLALALRSSTRAVPMATLGLALGAGALTAAARPRRNAVRTLVPVTLVLLAVLNLPSLWRHDHVDAALDRDEDPPSAWLEAAAALDGRKPGYRVFQVPGQEFGAYRWGYTVDQPLPGLTDRPLITRDLLPLGSPPAMDLLYAIDDRFQDGVLEPDTVAPVARLFGADTLWVTNDATYERFRTPRPEVMSGVFTGVPAGLGEPIPFGEPFVSTPDIPMTDEESVTDDRIGDAVAPVMLVPVKNPLPVIRAKTRAVIVSGSGDGVVDAAAAGLIDGTELLRYSADLPPIAEKALHGASSLIVTDSNRDRARRWNGSQDNVGFTESGGEDTDLLRAESADSRIPTFENTDPSTQTTAHQVGPVTAAVTAYGEPFAYRPEDRAAMAIDGRRDTAWRVADRSPDAIGQTIRLDVDEPIDHVTLAQPAAAGHGRHITAVELRVGDRPLQRVELGADSLGRRGQRIEIDPTGGPTTVSITVAATESPTPVPGPALAAVGFAEIDVGLEPTLEVVTPPTDLLARLAADDTDVPLSLVFTRQRYDATDRFRSDPEPSLVREVDLPMDVTASADITARLHPRVADSALLDLLGIDAPVADERVAGDPRSAGWATVDGDPATRWITPFAWVHGATLRVPLTGEPIDSFTITQPGGDEFNRITAVTVTAGDDDWLLPVPAPDGSGTSTITLPRAVSGDELALTISEIEERVELDRRYAEPVFLPAAISEISIGPRITLPERIDLGCRRDVLTVDGAAVPVRLTGDTAALLDGEPFTAVPCGRGGLRLDAGTHRVESTPGSDTGIDIDRVTLTTPKAPRASEGPSGLVPTHVVASSRTSTTIAIDGCPRGCWLVYGEGYNRAWSASSGDDDLGEPEPVDGGFNGWWIEPSNGPVQVTVAWTAQGPVTIGLIASGIVAVIALALIVLDRRQTAASPSRPVPAGFVAVGAATSVSTALVAALAGVATAGLFIAPIAAAWLAAAGAVVVAVRRPRLAGYAAAGTTLFIGAAVANMVRRDRPFPNGAWLEKITWLHPVGLAVVALAVIAAVDRP